MTAACAQAVMQAKRTFSAKQAALKRYEEKLEAMPDRVQGVAVPALEGGIDLAARAAQLGK